MKKWIRWPGLLVFLGVMGLFCFLFVFFIDGFVKRSIEKTGTALNEAKVELDKAEVSFFPLGIDLKHVQVSDRDAPMANAVEIAEIRFLIDPEQLSRRKVLIREMTVDGVQLNTPRKSSGVITSVSKQTTGEKGAAQKKETKPFELPALELPDVREILEKEELLSLTLAEDLKKEIKANEAKWEAKLAELPDKKTFESYRERVKKLKGVEKGGLGGILGGAAEVVSLQKEIRADLNKIRDAKDQLKKDTEALQGRIKEIPKAPLKDIERLKNKYTLSPKGLSHISRIFFGDKIGGWTGTAVQAYEKLSPFLAQLSGGEENAAVLKPKRGEGVDIHFQEEKPSPDFHVQVAKVTAQLKAGQFEGEVRHLSNAQTIVGLPLTFQFDGKAIPNVERVHFEGEINRINPAQPVDRFSLKASGATLQNLSLAKSKRFPVTLKTARTDVETLASIQSGTLDAGLTAQLKSVTLVAGLEKDNPPLVQAMADTLADVKSVQLKAGAKGPLRDYDLSLSSDLDDVLQKAVGKQVRAQANRFEKALKSAVTDKVDKALANVNAEFSGLDGLLGELTGRLNFGDGVLKDALAKSTGGLKLPF